MRGLELLGSLLDLRDEPCGFKREAAGVEDLENLLLEHRVRACSRPLPDGCKEHLLKALVVDVADSALLCPRVFVAAAPDHFLVFGARMPCLRTEEVPAV